MLQYTIQKIYHWDGMASQFHIGYTNCMGLAYNINAKYAAISAIGEGEHFKRIFNNGDILMG
jgi:hypothetical protein